MTYIHEIPDWPGFNWDIQALTQNLSAVRHKQGKHLGKIEALGFELQTEASVTTLTREIVTSSAIEGEVLDTAEVRSSIALKLGLDVAGLPQPGHRVDGIVEMMLDATQNFKKPLTAERLYGWHAALFPTGRSGLRAITVGAWRTAEHGPMQVVSGPMGNERVHFQAPDAGRLSQEMEQFLTWFNCSSELDPVLRAAVAHFWFITIHPFDDGNGRMARAIADMSLSRADDTQNRYYSMSAAIAKDRKEYYIRLESAQRGSLDITAWLAWFITCLDEAISSADEMLNFVLRKAELWQVINLNPVNERQRKVINRMLEPEWQGHLNTSKYAKLAKCSSDSALRDIKELLSHGVLVRNEGGGRSTSYRIADMSG